MIRKKKAGWAVLLTVAWWRLRMRLVIGAVAVMAVALLFVLWPERGGIPEWAKVGPDAETYQFGWARNDAEVERIAGGLAFRAFGDTPAGKAADALPQSVYLWQVYRQAAGAMPPVKNQRQVGSCVAFGTNGAIIRSLGSEIVRGAQYKVTDFAEEVTYAGSRVEVGKGRIGGDGSVGAWAAEFVRQWGMVPRDVHGAEDLREYSEQRCRAWGRSGVPAALEEVAKQYPVKATTLIKNWSEAKRALANGWAMAVCSDQGFEMTRDARGISRPRGSWAHCMCIDGYHTEGGEEFAHITNSWGPSAHRGPVGWGEPDTAGFWCSAAVAERMIAQGETWVFSGVSGFPARRLDWFVETKRGNRVANRGGNRGGVPRLWPEWSLAG